MLGSYEENQIDKDKNIKSVNSDSDFVIFKSKIRVSIKERKEFLLFCDYLFTDYNFWRCLSGLQKAIYGKDYNSKTSIDFISNLVAAIEDVIFEKYCLEQLLSEVEKSLSNHAEKSTQDNTKKLWNAMSMKAAICSLYESLCIVNVLSNWFSKTDHHATENTVSLLPEDKCDLTNVCYNKRTVSPDMRGDQEVVYETLSAAYTIAYNLIRQNNKKDRNIEQQNKQNSRTGQSVNSSEKSNINLVPRVHNKNFHNIISRNCQIVISRLFNLSKEEASNLIDCKKIFTEASSQYENHCRKIEAASNLLKDIVSESNLNIEERLISLYKISFATPHMLELDKENKSIFQSSEGFQRKFKSWIEDLKKPCQLLEKFLFKDKVSDSDGFIFVNLKAQYDVMLAIFKDLENAHIQQDCKDEMMALIKKLEPIFLNSMIAILSVLNDQPHSKLCYIPSRYASINKFMNLNEAFCQSLSNKIDISKFNKSNPRFAFDIMQLYPTIPKDLLEGPGVGIKGSVCNFFYEGLTYYQKDKYMQILTAFCFSDNIPRDLDISKFGKENGIQLPSSVQDSADDIKKLKDIIRFVLSRHRNVSLVPLSQASFDNFKEEEVVENEYNIRSLVILLELLSEPSQDELTNNFMHITLLGVLNHTIQQQDIINEKGSNDFKSIVTKIGDIHEMWERFVKKAFIRDDPEQYCNTNVEEAAAEAAFGCTNIGR